MKIKFMCEQCLLEKAPKGGGTFYMPFDPNSELELSDNYCYEFTCQNGHFNRQFLAVPRYAILFDMGINAYLDGYYREAALDFSASYERFHEYCIYLMLFRKKRGYDDSISKLWKLMAVQSERQYGAFVALYFSEIGELPHVLPQKCIEFRNAVTHKGKFPSKEDTYNYAFQVAEYVKSIINELSNDFGFGIEGMYPVIHEMNNSPCADKKESVRGHFFPTVITQYSCGNSFDDSIDLFIKQRHNNYAK